MFEYENHYAMKKNRLQVLQENNFTCRHCGDKATQIHHKDGSKNNHELENLIPVCHKCHMRLHWPKNKSPRWDTEAILVAMMQRGIDKGQLADRAGITSPTITNLLKTGSTKNSTMKRIANALEYPVEVFFLPGAAFDLGQLNRAVTINTIKLAIEKKLEIVQDPGLHRRYHNWIANNVRRYFGIKSYYNVPQERINEAIELINHWIIPGTKYKDTRRSL